MKLIAKVAGATSLILLLVAFSIAQTRNDFRAKYGDPAYEVRPGVWMLAKFAEDGQLCEAIIKERNDCRAGSVFLKTDTGIEELLYELAPAVRRGKLLSHSQFAGGCCDGFIDEYENVTVILSNEARLLRGNTFSAFTIRWKNRKCKVE